MAALNRKAGSAATRSRRIGIFDFERLADQVIDKIDPRAFEKTQRHRIDQHGRAVAFEHQIVGQRAALDIERILKARAAAAIHGDPQHGAGRLAGQNFDDATGGALGHLDIWKAFGMCHRWSRRCKA